MFARVFSSDHPIAFIIFISGSITEKRIAPTRMDVIRTRAGSTEATLFSSASCASSERRLAISSMEASPVPARIPSVSIRQAEACQFHPKLLPDHHRHPGGHDRLHTALMLVDYSLTKRLPEILLLPAADRC